MLNKNSKQSKIGYVLVHFLPLHFEHSLGKLIKQQDMIIWALEGWQRVWFNCAEKWKLQVLLFCGLDAQLTNNIVKLWALLSKWGLWQCLQNSFSVSWIIRANVGKRKRMPRKTALNSSPLPDAHNADLICGCQMWVFLPTSSRFCSRHQLSVLSGNSGLIVSIWRQYWVPRPTSQSPKLPVSWEVIYEPQVVFLASEWGTLNWADTLPSWVWSTYLSVWQNLGRHFVSLVSYKGPSRA